VRKVNGADAACVIDAACDVARVRYWEEKDEGPPDIVLPGLPPGLRPEDHEWTVGTVRLALRTIAGHVGITVKELFRLLMQRARRRHAEAKEGRNRITRELDQYRLLRSLPDADTRDRLARYEAHLERSLYRALHELQRQQAARGGSPLLPPVAVDVIIADDVVNKGDPPGDGSEALSG
jgi:hypothetical protein